MVKLVKRKTTVGKMDKKKYGGAPRTYLGMSGSGEECQRKRYYGFHWTLVKKYSARTERIFNAGHLFEPQIIKELKDIGCKVYKVIDGEEIEMTGDPNEEQESLEGFAGHEGGHPDGRILGLIEAPKTVHLLELKTMAHKYFLQVRRYGVKRSNPKYYGQVQKYMKKMKLKRCFFVAINKNDCEIHSERIEYDSGFADDLDRKDREVILAYEPPPKHYISGAHQCTAMCGFNGICHGDDKPDKNCRTCEFSDLENEGKWSCSNSKAIEKVSDGKCDNDEMDLPVKLQRKGCKFYKRGWGI